MQKNIILSFNCLLALSLVGCGGGGGSSQVGEDANDKQKVDTNIQVMLPTKNVKVLQTGQTNTYFSGDDGSLKQGIVRSFTRDDTTHTVIDNVNKLEWQDEKYTKEELKAYIEDKEFGKVKNWNNAVKYCQDKGDGWRLPSIKELSTIVNYGVEESAFIDTGKDLLNDSKGLIEPAFKYAINPNLGGDSSSQKYWSSTKGVDGYSKQAFVLIVANGMIQGNGFEQEDWVNYVRCVREIK